MKWTMGDEVYNSPVDEITASPHCLLQKKLKIILKWEFHIFTFRNWNVTDHILILELCGLNHLLVIRHEMDNGRWSVQLTSWQDHSIAPLPAAKKLKIILCKIRMSWSTFKNWYSKMGQKMVGPMYVYQTIMKCKGKKFWL